MRSSRVPFYFKNFEFSHFENVYQRVLFHEQCESFGEGVFLSFVQFNTEVCEFLFYLYNIFLVHNYHLADFGVLPVC